MSTPPIAVKLLGVGRRGLAGPPGPKGDKGDTGDSDLQAIEDLHGPLVVSVRDQSNSEVERDIDPALFTAAPNFKIWNWGYRAENTPGTAFITPPAGRIRKPWATCDLLARANPLRQVLLVNLCWGSQSIEHWTGGFDWKWSVDTANTRPDPGFVKVNSATPASINAIYINEVDSRGVNCITQITALPTGTKISFKLASDASVNLTLVTTGAPVDNGDWHAIPVVFSAGAGGFADAAALKVMPSPDMWAITTREMPLALAAANASTVGLHLDGQIEANSAFPLMYPTDFETVMGQYYAQSWFPANTPIGLWAQVNQTPDGGFVHRRTSNLMRWRIAQVDPENRLFLYHNLYGPDFWEPIPEAGDLAVHTTALGDLLYGRSTARALLDRLGRNIPAGITVDPELGTVEAYGSLAVGDAQFDPPGQISLRKTGSALCRVTVEGEVESVVRTVVSADSITSPLIETRKSRGTIAAPAIVQANDTLGQIIAYGWDSAAWRSATIIRSVIISSSPAPGDFQGRIVFLMNAAGSGSSTDMFRFDTGGLSMVGGNVVIDGNRIIRLRSYTISTLPSAAPAGQMIYCSDLAGGGGQMVSDGAGWMPTRNLKPILAVTTDADFTLTPLVDFPIQRHTGTLTADRTITLSTTNGRNGMQFRVKREGGGAGNLIFAGKTLTTGTFAEATLDSSNAWRITDYGAF